MIGYLEGRIKLKGSGFVILLTSSGVGYKMYVSSRVLERVKIEEDLSFFVHTHVREDQISLFGFLALQDLDVFELLITVSGVGPKTAMNIFSVGSGEQIEDAILNKNKLFFKGVSGLGSKTIEKIFVELSGKVGDLKPIDRKDMQINTSMEEAIGALQNLGYQSREIYDFFRKNLGIENEKVEEIIKKFLKK